MMKSTIVSILIGFVTAVAGFPIYNWETHTFSPRNFIVLMVCLAIGQILCYKSEK